ncbi:SulP family inorganic anion transporter [Oscillochloris sp. ZM17-4]|uniref:SulP family inorganic anion transporter n=1 Tax=Oscillochloris sp. ZM17-4 TaxID=2866714 RepID=UPI001C7359DE|nr:SulP family inorganic anion transporter [Oscillochloris sp. ZM17-4]MBX0326379.1 SulP family inorganic anion transporter [Oscillochloris sp. ZM17-4]
MGAILGRLGLPGMLRREFAGYNRALLQRDLLAGLTVGAVALPLALAFGVASGADAAAGLVTAILAGLIIGSLGGGSFQISGPTGAMSAILIVIAQGYGLSGVWVACVMAGALMLVLGLLRLGRYIAFIPSPVITGFTSGIALIIAVGQIDNVLGVKTEAAENTVAKLWGYIIHPPTPNWQSLAVAGIVMATMLLLPRITKTIPASLVGLILASLLATGLGWQVATIGSIPQTIILDNRLTLASVPWGSIGDLLSPAISIAALGAIESLLCGSVGATMTGKPFDSNTELIAQGIGNMIIPFFGGVPATAAIARTSVAIKSNGATRITSIVHAFALLLSALLLAPLIGQVPLAALGGVLMVTAWRMNEWETIHFYWHTKIKHALAGILVTMVATAALDLTQAILIGLTISAIIYIRQSAQSTAVASEPVDAAKLRAQGYNIEESCPSVHVYYLTGPLFFGSVHTVLESFASARQYHTLLISMRGVPLIDAMGAKALHELIEEHHTRGGVVAFTGLQPTVREMFARTGLTDLIGEEQIYWSAIEAIIQLHERREIQGCPHCDAQGDSCTVLRAAIARREINPPPA